MHRGETFSLSLSLITPGMQSQNISAAMNGNHGLFHPKLSLTIHPKLQTTMHKSLYDKCHSLPPSVSLSLSVITSGTPLIMPMFMPGYIPSDKCKAIETYFRNANFFSQ